MDATIRDDQLNDWIAAPSVTFIPISIRFLSIFTTGKCSLLKWKYLVISFCQNLVKWTVSSNDTHNSFGAKVNQNTSEWNSKSFSFPWICNCMSVYVCMDVCVRVIESRIQIRNQSYFPQSFSVLNENSVVRIFREQFSNMPSREEERKSERRFLVKWIILPAHRMLYAWENQRTRAA